MTGLKNNVIYIHDGERDEKGSFATRLLIVSSTTYREFWQSIGISNLFFCAAGLVCGALALSVLLPFFAEPLSRENLRKRLPALTLVLLWSVPNLFLSIAQRPLPHLEKLGFRHSTGILFPYYNAKWFVHHFEVKKGPQSSWETLPNSFFFVPELPLGGSRLELYVIYSNRDPAGGKNNAVIASLLDQISERIKADPQKFPDVCALRLVSREYSPVTQPALHRAFDADNLEAVWTLSSVLAERALEDRCRQG